MTTNVDPNTIQFAGDFKLSSIKIGSYNGAEIDVTALVRRIEIYEDINSPFLTTEIVLIDSIGLESQLPIVGEEFVEMNLVGPEGSGYKQKQFFVYKIKDRYLTSDRAVTYTLCCMSSEALVDMNLKISKSYAGNISDVVFELLKTEGLTTEKDFFIEETKNSVQYVSNYWTPSKNLAFLASRAISKTNDSASFVFFETSKGFVFTSLDNLISQQSQMSYYNSPRVDSDITKALTRVERIFFDDAIDYIKRAQSGAYGCRSLLVDPLTKSYEYKSYDFTEAFDKRSTLNESPFSSNNATRRLNTNFDTRTAPSYSYDSQVAELNDQWFSRRRTELASREAIVGQIDVPGAFYLNAGSVIDLFCFNGSVNKSDSSELDLYSLVDRVHSGRYLVSKLKHTITTERHFMSLEITKDSLIKNTTINGQ